MAPGIDDPIAMIDDADNVTYFHDDGKGTIVALSDGATGSTIDIFTHGPFGELDANTGGSAYKFTARRIDEETGLYYYRNRYYHPRMGRFMSADPIGYGDGLNMYAYVGNDPVNNVDPWGVAGVSYILCPLPFVSNATGGMNGSVTFTSHACRYVEFNFSTGIGPLNPGGPAGPNGQDGPAPTQGPDVEPVCIDARGIQFEDEDQLDRFMRWQENNIYYQERGIGFATFEELEALRRESIDFLDFVGVPTSLFGAAKGGADHYRNRGNLKTLGAQTFAIGGILAGLWVSRSVIERLGHLYHGRQHGYQPENKDSACDER